MVKQSQDRSSLHHTSRGVTQEFAPRLECAIDADVVLWCHEKIARLGWVVRGLL